MVEYKRGTRNTALQTVRTTSNTNSRSQCLPPAAFSLRKQQSSTTLYGTKQHNTAQLRLSNNTANCTPCMQVHTCRVDARISHGHLVFRLDRNPRPRPHAAHPPVYCCSCRLVTRRLHNNHIVADDGRTGSLAVPPAAATVAWDGAPD